MMELVSAILVPGVRGTALVLTAMKNGIMRYAIKRRIVNSQTMQQAE